MFVFASCMEEKSKELVVDEEEKDAPKERM